MKKSFTQLSTTVSKLFKYTLLLSATMVLTTSAAMAQQTKLITLKLDNVTIEKVVETLKATYGTSFVLRTSDVNMSKVVSVDVKNQPLFSVMESVFKGENVKISVSGNSVSIVKKSTAVAQNDDAAKGTLRVITGRVTDESGAPVPGATIIVKGTTTGTISGVDGTYSLRTAQNNCTLQYTFVGYETVERPVSAATGSVDVAFRQSAVAIDEVVAIGYGVQNRRDVSSSISSVKSSDVTNVPITDFRQALAGKMPGVQIMQTSGDPEGAVSIRVRGVSTATAGNDPLYVIDGMPVERGLMHLNNNDIESIEVLKDASSAAIYGSRGANGVIMITTKQGKTERIKVSYDGYYGVQQVSKKIDMLNAYQFAELSKDGHDNAYLDEVPGASVNDPNSKRPQGYHQTPYDLMPYLDGTPGLTDTDWQDAIFRIAPTHSHNISVSGKTKVVNYFVSGNYYKQDGIIICSDMERYSMRINLDGEYKKFKFGVNFTPTYSTSNKVNASGQYTDEGVVASALSMPPNFPIYNDDGSYNYQGNGFWRIGTDYQNGEVLNPVALANLNKNQVDRVSLLGRVFAEYELYKGLSYNVSVGGDFYAARGEKYRHSSLPLRGYKYYDAPSNPVASTDSQFNYNWIVENKLSYARRFGNHNISAILVYSAQKETSKVSQVGASNFPNDLNQTITGGTVTDGKSSTDRWSLASYLARVQYSYAGKYMLSAAIRRDGSSRFGKDNRWGSFPSASLGWRVSDEPFLKGVQFIDDFKLRASYGVTGNFQIGNYEHFTTVRPDDYVLGPGDGILAPGYAPQGVINSNLRWEKSAMMNTGFDLMMFKGLLSMTVEYYNTNTKDLLLSIPVPHTSGTSTARTNIGKVNNQGWEFSVGSQKQFKNFGYTFSANLSRNVNEVKALGPGNTPIIKPGSYSAAYYITKVGAPIGSYYLLVQDGIFTNAAQLEQYPHFANTQPGDFRFVDVDKDGVMDVDKDRAIVGNYMPDFTYGFSGSLNYKGFDLAFAFQGVYGNEILNLNRRYNDNMEGNFNCTTAALNRWKSESEPGDGNSNRANRKSKGNNGRTSTWHIEDGSYLRLQNITLGYTLPKLVTSRIGIENIRVYVAGKNLWTMTDYSGYNPEVSNRPENALTPGEDYGTYPLAKVVTVGLNITF